MTSDRVDLNSRIIGGTPAKRGQYKFYAAYEYASGSAFCGSSLIEKNWALTAAHCNPKNEQPASAYQVRVSAYERWTPDPETEEIRQLSQYITYPERNPETRTHDYALLNFQNPVSADKVKPVDLFDAAVFAENPAPLTIIGLGYEDSPSKGYDGLPQQLIQADTTFVPAKECRTWGHRLDDSMMCIQHNDVTACNGDSGGPLFFHENGEPKQIGICSFGVKGCPVSRPNVYAHLTPNILEFIKRTIFDPTACPAGTTSNDAQAECVPCEAGTISNAGGAPCTDCPAGTTSNEERTECVQCGAGTTSKTGGPCTDCPAGTTSNDARKKCEQCPAGTKSKAGAPCTACRAGKTSNDARTKCVAPAYENPNNFYYRAFTDRRSYKSAQNRCRRLGSRTRGALAVPANWLAQAKIKNAIRARNQDTRRDRFFGYWVGGVTASSHTQVKSQWRWDWEEDQIEMTNYENWCTTNRGCRLPQPDKDVNYGAQKCMQMIVGWHKNPGGFPRYTDYTWDNFFCWSWRPYVCMFEKGTHFATDEREKGASFNAMWLLLLLLVPCMGLLGAMLLIRHKKNLTTQKSAPMTEEPVPLLTSSDEKDGESEAAIQLAEL